jgi:phospholipid/cholesterol/gamma-HCH transport system permease protein
MPDPGNIPTEALLSASRSRDVLTIALGGVWSIHGRTPGAGEALQHFKNGSSPEKINFETSKLESYDSSLISCLLGLAREVSESETAIDRSGLPKGVNDLLSMALAVPEKRDAHDGVTETAFFTQVGTASLALWNGLMDLFNFIGQCILSFGRLIRGRARFRRRELWMTIQECGAEALPIVTLINLLIGMILAFVGTNQLGSMGATIFVANLVALAMTREMGAIMTGIIMSGRTGAAFAAQIGSMKTNEEIDALKTFGFNEIDFLVLPRMLALIVMMPLLTVYANAVGMLGGLIVGMLSGLGFQQYFDQTVNALDLTSCAIGISKSIVFGVIIAAAGCLRGMQCGSSASAVGTAATSAAVSAITAIIIADAFFAVLLQFLGI